MDHSAYTLDNASLTPSKKGSQLFVEIPRSPLFKTRVASTPSKVEVLIISRRPQTHKERVNPLSVKPMVNNIPLDKKRKAKCIDQHELNQAAPNAKKTKISRLSNGDVLVACHQCRTKKQSSLVWQCTGISKTTGNRCKAAYCDTCLKNRYGRELQYFNQNDSPVSRANQSGIKYHFICPRCEGNCNCAPCRKRKGLPPVGKFTLAQDGRSVREILEDDPQALGILPKNTAPMSNAVRVDKSLNTDKGPTKGIQMFFKPLGERKTSTGDTRKKIPKAVPEPIWVPVPLKATKEEIEDRICLREFILRFNPILNISQRSLDDLDDFTSLHDTSTKAILLVLLDLIAAEDETQKKTIQAQIKIIRSQGFNWTKIIPILYDLRATMPRGHVLSLMPDIISNSVAETSHNTRRTRMQGLYADQLMPVLLYLIQIAVDGASVRQELEEGNRQAKEVRAACYKAMREETERWMAEKVELVGLKPPGEKNEASKAAHGTWKVKFRKAEEEHKTVIKNIRNTHKSELDCCAPRFTSLGCDTQGRTYYALSASGPQRGKKERLPSEAERSAMKKWGWFIAAFGKPGTEVRREIESDVDEDTDEDENAERWWGFADVAEMRKLAKWLVYCAEVETADDPDGQESNVLKESSAVAPATSSTLISRPASPSDTPALSCFESRSPSPASDIMDSLSEKDDSKEPDVDADKKPRKMRMSQSATSTHVKTLAKAILEFADFTDWRLNHSLGGTGNKQRAAITPENFYG